VSDCTDIVSILPPPSLLSMHIPPSVPPALPPSLPYLAKEAWWTCSHCCFPKARGSAARSLPRKSTTRRLE
jgi:hypothetical protein